MNDKKEKTAMKANRVIWSMTGVCLAAALAGALKWGQTTTIAATTTAPSAPAGMVLIPAGTNSGTGPDMGAYSLTVSAFYMDQHEVTKALWDEVYAWAVKNGYGFTSDGSGKAANHPVQSINWYDAVKWCNARSEKEGRPACYRRGADVYRNGPNDPGVKCDLTAAGYRLPTAVEWEYAARGGLSGKRFPWGDTIDHDKANCLGHPSGLAYDKGYEGYDKRYSTDGNPFTAPVGSFPANGYGLHDMTGNVWEWCWDWSPAAPNAHRMIRGGAWSYSTDYSRVASCSNNLYPESSYWSIGFRSVLTPGK